MALRIFESKDLNTVGAIADSPDNEKWAIRAAYIINRYKLSN